jgi:hypothetical protein
VSSDNSKQVGSSHRTLKPMVYLWLGITGLMSYEYLALNKLIGYPSLLRKFQSGGVIPRDFKLITDPGAPISYILGISGFALICLTNLYIIKKKRHSVKPSGSLGNWLNYHILFGLLGPTLILFHCDFRVRGLVAISFWSMIVCFISGVIGRYFYIQLLKERRDMKKTMSLYDEAFEKARNSIRKPWDKQILEEAKWRSFVHVGGSAELQTGRMGLPLLIVDSILGDMRRHISHFRLPEQLPLSLYKPLIEYALVKRRFHSTDQYKMLMGYWHTFHVPFAFFMYVVTIIHIVVAVTLKVN